MPERLVRELASLSFLETATNVLFLGPPGVGKTHLASALAAKALDAGHSVLFTTLAGLAEALEGSPSPTAHRPPPGGCGCGAMSSRMCSSLTRWAIPG